MKKILVILLLMIGFFFYHINILDAKMKKVLVLGFNNYTGDLNYKYIEPTLTDAVRSLIKKKFIFEEFKRKRVLEYAKNNYFFETDFFTPTSSIKLGLELNIDIVISGGFKIIKRPGKTPLMVTKTGIYDISKRKVLKEIVIEGPVDNQIFKLIEKIAERVAKEAKSILPNEEEYKKQLLEEPESNMVFDNQITIFAGLYPSAIQGDQKELLGAEESILPKDIKNVLSLTIDYNRDNFLFNNIFLWSSFNYNMGSSEFATTVQNVNADASLNSYRILAGVGHKFFFLKDFFMSSAIGGGFVMGAIDLKSKVGNNLTVDETFNTSGPVLALSLGTGYMITKRIGIEVKVAYNTIFYVGGTSASTSTSGGILFKF